MKAKKALIWVLVLSCSILCNAAEAESYQFVVEAGGTEVLAAPLSLGLEGVDYGDGTVEPSLNRLEKGKQIPVPCQLDNVGAARILFIPDRTLKPNKTATYELTFEKSDVRKAMAASVDEKSIVLSNDGDKILSYYHTVCEAPEGTNPLYRRSGFIHPLWSPEGNVLTRIQPPDHYHHYGIWNPWTKTHVEGREVDFWNLAKGQGRVQFAGILSTVSGAVYGGFKVRQEHLYYDDDKKGKTAINEALGVRAHACKIDNQAVWIIDYICILSGALDSPIELVNYRYGGGIGFRATEKWDKDNCTVLTSAGKTRKDADGSRARWCDVNGGVGESKYSGVLFLSHSANREHPEPMRVWPTNVVGGRGDMFFEFCPIRHKSWTLESQKEYVLRYRMIVYDGKFNPATAETLWKNYTQPPVITLKR